MRRNPSRFPLVKFFAATLLFSGTASGTFLTSCGSTSPQTSIAQSSPAANTSSASPSPAANTENRLRVVATFLPIYLFTKAVVGNAAQVDILIKPGTEVHEYQSTPADVRAISESDVVIKNGLGLEEFLDETIESAQNSKLKVVDASQGIKPIDELSQVVHTGTEQRHNHTKGNPHVWLDPVLAKQQVENIRDGIIAADPNHKAKYEANAAAYLQQLTDLNKEFEQGLGKFRDRTFITFHDAFPYLAQRYNLKQVAVVEIPEDQLSPTDVKETIDTVKQFQAKALFSEPGVDNKLLDGLSKDLNVKLRPLDSLEAGQTDPQHYFTAMRSNLQTLEEAFK